MAKQSSMIQVVGKVGNLVGYKNTLARKAGTTFVRQAPESVSNPKTYKQARQRAKTVPAQLFYNAFSSVLNHAFLPKARASKNWLRFLSKAMSLDAVPWVFQGEKLIPFNVPYQVSLGSLGLDVLARATGAGNIAPGVHSAVFFPNFQAALGLDAASVRELTVAQFTALVLAGNPNLQEGMELTFLAVLCNVNEPSLRAGVHFSVVLNSSDSITTLDDILGSNHVELVSDDDSGVIQLACPTTGSWAIGAGAMIISSRSADSWKYTNSFMARSLWAMSAFNYDEDAVIRSYMAEDADASSDLILQQADNTAASGLVTPRVGANEPYTIATPVAGATYNHAAAAIVTMTDGSRRVVVDDIGAIQYYDASSQSFEPVTQTVSDTEGSETTSVLFTLTTWAGNNTIGTAEAARANFQ